MKHALSGSLAVFIIGLAVFFIMANFQKTILWVGVDSLVIIGVYLVAVNLLQSNPMAPVQTGVPAKIPPGTPGLRSGLIGFGLAAGGLVIVTPYLVSSSTAIAEVTGLGTTFIGTTLVALVTSLPEMVTTLAALRIGADDMAIGNLFGSNLFNMFALGLTDFFYVQGRFLEVIDPAFLVVGMLGLLMTGMGLIGNLARLERRVWFVEIDALMLLIVYFLGMWMLYVRGIGS
jgi:cation:H+ antiporter